MSGSTYSHLMFVSLSLTLTASPASIIQRACFSIECPPFGTLMIRGGGFIFFGKISMLPPWVAKLRIDVEMANDLRACRRTPIMKQRTVRKSPLSQCGTPGCVMNARIILEAVGGRIATYES